MNLTNDIVTLSRFTESDIDLFSEIRTSPVMMEHVYDVFSLEACKERFKVHLLPWSIESKHWLSFVITYKETNEKVGDIGFKVIDPEQKIGEVGFMVRPGFQGKGIGTAALSLIVELAFRQFGFNKLTAICSINNTASYSLLEKHGFVREKKLKNNSKINGQYVDDFYYVLENVKA